MNKDLILREKLAVQRTHLANQTTFLSFLRTSMYFFVAGLSIESFFAFSKTLLVMWIFFGLAFALCGYGVLNFFKNRRMILENERHIGGYKDDFIK